MVLGEEAFFFLGGWYNL